MTNQLENLPDLNDWCGNTWAAKAVQDTGGGSLFALLRIPSALHDVMEFAGVRFAPKTGGRLWSKENLANPAQWILTLPTNAPGKRVEIPLPDEISKTDPEGHWRAILAAAADYQALVNTGRYKPD